MIKYAHIGYPKNFSTSLQRSVFSRHKDIYHLGVGIDSNIGYRDDLLTAIFEVYLKTAKRFKYREVERRLRQHIEHHYGLAEELGSRAFGFSSEHISFSFSYEGLSLEEKLERLIGLFGPDLHLVIIIREQMDLIRSLYRESVRVGLPMTYAQYLYSLYKFQDRNFLYDLRYDMVAEAALRLVGRDNVHFLTFEGYRKDGEMVCSEDDGRLKLVTDVCGILGVDYFESDFLHLNEALSDEAVIRKAELNTRTAHDLGNHLYSSAELHRQAAYFGSELGLEEREEEIYRDVRVKRELIREAMDTAAPAGAQLYTGAREKEQQIKAFFADGNRKFEEVTNLGLPLVYGHQGGY